MAGALTGSFSLRDDLVGLGNLVSVEVVHRLLRDRNRPMGLLIALAVFLETIGTTGGAIHAAVFSFGSATIDLTVPPTWHYDESTADQVLHLALSPMDGRDARLLITGFPLPTDSQISSEQDLRQLVAQGGERLLAGATQTTLEIQQIKTAAGPGFLYHLTDVEPEDSPDDYREMTQGAVLLDGHLLTVTILTHPGDQVSSAEAKQIVESTRMPAPEGK
jgi:hypothetical protein